MSEHLGLVFAPMLPVPWLEALAVMAASLVAYALFRRAKGAVWRGVLFALLILVLADPSLIAEQRAPLKDTALIVVDQSASMKLGGRDGQAARALDAIRKKLAAFNDLDTVVTEAKGTTETDLFRAAEEKFATIPQGRLAGIIFITDGEVHDKPGAALAAPLHVLIAGKHGESDRRIAIATAPAYGIVGRNVTISVRVTDAPKAQSETAAVTLTRDDGESVTAETPIGRIVKFEVPVRHPGPNLFAFSAAALPGELTPLNNETAVTVNGVRDRLRVLLVSGEPHIGGRTWRDFLKSDPAVDLVHFTILRSPGKPDFAPNSELALIAFPVEQLFETKLSSFDLVIFDRFRQQSLIPDNYLDNIANYVEKGGALLVSNATDENIPSLALSPLARVLPTQPAGRLLTGAFVPKLTEEGQRDPVTDTLAEDMPPKDWGPWFRQTGARVKNNSDEVLMTGLDGEPLLVLARAGQGRVAQFLSDQFWLWARGYGGERLRGAQNEPEITGGPQADLLKRVAHWLMKEPELDEKALRARAEPVSGAGDTGWQLVITKRSLKDNGATVTVTDPQGKARQVTLAPGGGPGLLTATLPVAETGLYRVKDGDQEILAMAGPGASPEFGDMVATEKKLAPYVEKSGGGIFWLADRPDGPAIRRTSAGGSQQGWGWIGLRRNDRYRVTGSTAYPLWPVWLAIAVLLGVMMGAWRKEGQS